jgi:hypothetical protein
MPMIPESTEDIKLDTTRLFLFIGPADAGKTYASTSFGLRSKKYGGTDDRPAYMLELDGRIAALASRPVVYNKFTNEEGAIGVLNRLKELRESCIKNGRAPFHALIVSSFTAFNDFAIADSLDVTESKREAGADKGRVRGELTLMTTEDYGYEAEAVRKLLWENLLDLKKYCDVIVEAHETEHYRPVKTKPGEPTRTELAGYKVLARDKIAAKLPTRFDEIYHFLPKEVVVSQQTIRRRVVFNDMVARTSFKPLQSTAIHDISGKEFYTMWRGLIEGTIAPVTENR